MKLLSSKAQGYATEWGTTYLEPAIAELDRRLEQQAALLKGRLMVAEKQWGPTHHDCQRLAQELSEETRVAELLAQGIGRCGIGRINGFLCQGC